jgi:hypothetical protein
MIEPGEKIEDHPDGLGLVAARRALQRFERPREQTAGVAHRHANPPPAEVDPHCAHREMVTGNGATT